MLQNIIFDFNGTLLDDGYLCYKIEDEIFKELNCCNITFEDYLKLFDHPVTTYYKNIGIDENKFNYDQISSEFFYQYNKRWSKEASLFEGVVETLLFLRINQYKVYILSATEINLLKEQLNKLGIIDYFDELVASNNNDAKGKKEYGLEFIKSHNFDKSNTIIIGDTVHDFEASEYFDINCLLFSKGHNHKDRLISTGAPVVDSYKEILDYIVNFRTYNSKKRI